MNKPKIRTFAEIVKNGKKPVIMQVVPNLNMGGVEQCVINENKAIVKAGGVSIVVSNGGRRAPEITRDGGKFIELPVHSKNPLTMIKNVKRLRKIIRDNNVDIVNACSRAPAWSAKPACKGTKAIYMTSCHAAHKINFPFKRFYNSSVKRGDLVMVSSNYLGELIEKEYGIESSRIRVVHRGVTLEHYSTEAVTQHRVAQLIKDWRLPDDKLIIFLPARITRIKGHKFVVDAIEKLDRDDIFCAFAGNTDGSEEYAEKLGKYIEKKGLGSKIRLVGRCNDMPAAYNLATVSLMPSLVPEGFGLVAVESQAMGRPIIATNHGGAKESIIPEKTGWLVEPNDAEGLAHTINDALSLTKKQRETFAQAAIKNVQKNFSNKKTCTNVLNIYAELLCINKRCNDK